MKIRANRNKMMSDFQSVVMDIIERLLWRDSGFKKVVDDAAEGLAKTASEKFIECLVECIDNCKGDDHEAGEIGEDIANRLKEVDVSTPEMHFAGSVYLDEIDGVPMPRCTIRITHKAKDTVYKSLYEEGYPEGVDNIVEYMNYGTAGESSGVAYGQWHGHLTYGLQKREGAGFAESAVKNFKDKYGKSLNVVDVSIFIDH